MTVLSLLGATAAVAAAASERDPEPRPRKRDPAPTVEPAAASEPELENPITAAAAQQLQRAGTSPALSGPVQLVVRALIHREDVQEPPAPQAAPEPKQAAAPVIGVAEGHHQSPLTVEQPASAPEQQLLLAESPEDGFPSPVIPVFLIFALFMYLLHTLIDSAL